MNLEQYLWCEICNNRQNVLMVTSTEIISFDNRSYNRLWRIAFDKITVKFDGCICNLLYDKNSSQSFIFPSEEISEFLNELVKKMKESECLNKEHIWELRQWISKNAPSTNSIKEYDDNSNENILNDNEGNDNDEKEKNANKIDIEKVKINDLKFVGHDSHKEDKDIVGSARSFIVYRLEISGESNGTVSWCTFKRWSQLQNIFDKLHNNDKAIKIPKENLFKAFGTSIYLYYYYIQKFI